MCFVHFDLEMCFGPQRRALFRNLNFQKCSGPGVLCTFWLGNVLRATTACIFFHISTSKSAPDLVCFVHFDLEMCFAPQTACTFSKSQPPTMVWEWCVLYILTWKCAARHKGVQFFFSYLASWLRTRRFSEVTFRPSRAPNHWKNKVNRDFPTFSRTCIFLLPTLSLLWSSHFLTSPLWLFPPLLFHLCILSEVWLLNFLRLCTYISRYVHIQKNIIYIYIHTHRHIYIYIYTHIYIYVYIYLFISVYI